jgi:peptide/nickel transport system substrate-binding protein
MMRGRTLCFTLSALVLAGLLTACSLSPEARGTDGSAADRAVDSAAKTGSSDQPPASGKKKPDEFNDEATGKEVPVKGGQIVVGFPVEPHSLNFWLESTTASHDIDRYIFDTLLRQNPETFEWEPNLAERWIEEDVVLKNNGEKLRGITTDSPGSQTGPVILKAASGETLRIPRAEVKEVHKGAAFTFFLHKNVKFHDGVPLTADDVKFSYDTLRNESVDAPSLRLYYADVESCEVLDKYTVRMTYSKQYWMARFYMGTFFILPKHIYDADGLQEKDPKAFGKRFNESQDNRKPIGTGAYKFDRWDTGIQVVLSRNDDYFNVERRGHVDRIVYKFITDLVAALQAFKNGDVNFLESVTPAQYQDETASPEFLKRFVKVVYYTPNVNLIAWNMRRPPFNDVKVRQAMEYGAFDRQEFMRTALHGLGVVVTGEQFYLGPAYDRSILPHQFDPEKAKQLLLEAGWYDRDGDGLRDKNGQPFRFELLLPSGTDNPRRRAALMKENLRKLGIDMTIRELEWATFIENINDRKFDVVNAAWAGEAEEDPYQLWHTSQSENRGSNYTGFGNAETDRMLENARMMIDDKERHEFMFRFQRLLNEQQPYLFLYSVPDLGLYDKRFRGVKFYPILPGYDLTEWFLPQGAGQSG